MSFARPVRLQRTEKSSARTPQKGGQEFLGARASDSAVRQVDVDHLDQAAGGLGASAGPNPSDRGAIRPRRPARHDRRNVQRAAGKSRSQHAQSRQSIGTALVAHQLVLPVVPSSVHLVDQISVPTQSPA